MTVDDAVLSKVTKYGKLIKKKEKVAHALARLNNIEMTLEILSATNIGRYVNKLCHDAEYGRDASRIIEKWKEIARQSGVRGGDEDRNSEDDQSQQSPNLGHNSNEQESFSKKGYGDDSRDRHYSDNEDGYNVDSDEHSSGRHRRKVEKRDNYHEERRSDDESHDYDERHHSDHSGYGDDDRSRQSDYNDEIRERNFRDIERGSDNDSDDDNANKSLDRNYDSDEYSDVANFKTCATSSNQSEVKDSRKRRHHLEEPGSSQHSSHPKTKKVSSSKKVVTEFDMILQSADSGPPKHKKQREPHIKWTEMPVLTNYQPFPQAVRAAKDPNAPPVDDFNPENMFKPRNERGKVFAGRRKNTPMIVPSLFNICLRVLGNNIGVLLYAEYIPYDVLKPVLEKCTDEELASIESKHPYIEDDSGELWEKFVSKKYPGEEPASDGTWKDLYYFLEKEKEEKLKRLSKRIGKMHQADSTKAQRKTILADATAPLSVRRRQMQHGIAHMSRPLPSAIEVSSARRKIFETGGSKAALSTLPTAVVNRNSTVGAKTDRHAKKPPAKKGALMIKTMKMLNMRRK
ncbi:unnamed protein product [Strongylus vulgaris]|uniref:TFIIS N-terminal domain-containing protein n=1 Tax=Strongylus vulgaris TaxID=40348 RepID=A0A3P7LBY8_STRVU|nr:unnamed protein product [Strongylus vulgaris]